MLTAFEQIRQSPILPFYVKELEAFLKKEQANRKAFYKTLTEDTNAEFINGEIIRRLPTTETQ